MLRPYVVRSENSFGQGLNAGKPAPENLKLILHMHPVAPRPAKSQIVEALRYFSKRLSCLSLATGHARSGSQTTTLLMRMVLFRSSRAFPLGSLQLGVGSDVDGVALVIPSGQPY